MVGKINRASFITNRGKRLVKWLLRYLTFIKNERVILFKTYRIEKKEALYRFCFGIWYGYILINFSYPKHVLMYLELSGNQKISCCSWTGETSTGNYSSKGRAIWKSPGCLPDARLALGRLHHLQVWHSFETKMPGLKIFLLEPGRCREKRPNFACLIL